MRDPRKTIVRSNRLRTIHSHISKSGRRKALAAALLLITSPMAMGDEPQTPAIRMLPPLPVHQVQPAQQSIPVQQVANHEVYENPFCEPALHPIRQGDVKLASSQAQSAIRLKSMGNVVGLQPIGTGKPIQVRPRGIKIEAPISRGIQSNPLIQSEHHANPELVNVSLPAPTVRNELYRDPDLQEMVMAPRGTSEDVSLQSVPHPSMPLPIQLDVGAVSQTPTTDIAQHLTSPVTANPVITKPAAKSILVQPVTTKPVVAARVQRSILARPEGQPTDSSRQANGALIVPAMPTVVNPAANQKPATSQVERAVVSSPLMPATQPIPVAKSTQAPSVAAAIPTTTPAESQPQGTEESTSNPVFFSMSDSSKSAAAIVPDPAEDAIESPSDLVGKTVKPVVISDLDSQADRSVVAIAEPIGLTDPIAQAVPDEVLPELPEPTQLDLPGEALAMPSLVRRDQPVVGRPVSAKDPSVNAALSSHKRYRAPVAVVAPPVAMTQSRPPSVAAKTVSARIPVTMAQPVNVPQPRLPAKATELTTLHLTKAQVRSLTIGGMVRRVNVTNKNICQAIATGPNQLKLIGTGNGVTRLVVWADTSGNSRTRARTFEIHVQDAVEATGGSVGDKTHTLNQSIFDAFPHASVTVEQQRDRLIVSGECESEDDAKKIIRMVRKTCLIPVRDEIKVR